MHRRSHHHALGQSNHLYNFKNRKTYRNIFSDLTRKRCGYYFSYSERVMSDFFDDASSFFLSLYTWSCKVPIVPILLHSAPLCSVAAPAQLWSPFRLITVPPTYTQKSSRLWCRLGCLVTMACGLCSPTKNPIAKRESSCRQEPQHANANR